MADSQPKPPTKPPNQQINGAGSQTQGVQLLPLITKYFKTAGVLLLAWSAGYFRFSSTWVLIGMFFYVINEEYRKVKSSKRAFAQQAILNEKQAILARVDELPSWVYFPDIERAEWLNKMLKQMWPYIGDYLEDYLKSNVQPMVDNSMPSSLKPFRFEKIDLGDIPPRIGGVKVYTENVKRDEIIMDLELFYAGDCQVTVAVRGMNAGIRDFTLHGTVRIVMKPLVNIIPIIGGMQIFFLNQPNIDFDLTNAANILDIPLLSQSLRTVVEDYVSQFMVLPNKIPVTLAANVQSAMLRNIMPQGVIRIQCVAARELKKADISVFGKGKSDPYLKVYVGATTFKTKCIEDTVNPVWNDYFEAPVDQKYGQFVELECLDKDPGDDDELGTASIDIDSVAKTGSMDTWLPLENVKTGMVHVRALWLHLSKDPEDLGKENARRRKRVAIEEKRLSTEAMNTADTADAEMLLSSAILRVSVDSAKALPRRLRFGHLEAGQEIQKMPKHHWRQKKSMGEPSPFARLRVGNEEKKTSIKLKTTDPRWEESFLFLINNPNQQDLYIDVIDSNKGEKKLGTVSIPLKSCLTAPDLIINCPFQLKESGINSKIVLRLCLRILTSQAPAAWAVDTVEDHLEQDVPDEGSSVDPPSQPADAPLKAEKPSQPSQPEPGKAPKQKEEPQATNNSNGNFVLGSPDEDEEKEIVAEKEVMQEAIAKQETDISEIQTGLRQRGLTMSSGEGEMSKFGRIQLTLRYSPPRQKLMLVVVKCMNLIPCDEDNLADPYVRIYMNPEKSKRKTQIIKNNLNPIFDETFEWDVTMQELALKTLEISVKNKNSMFSTKREHMGQLTLALGQTDLSKALTQWYDLEDPDSK